MLGVDSEGWWGEDRAGGGGGERGPAGGGGGGGGGVERAHLGLDEGMGEGSLGQQDQYKSKACMLCSTRTAPPVP